MNNQTPLSPSSYNLPPLLDVDQTLTDGFSSLTLNNNSSDLQNYSQHKYDGVGFNRFSENQGFMMNGLNDNFRVYNGGNRVYNNGFYSGAGNANPHFLDRGYMYEYQYPPYGYDGASSSSCASGFNFDKMDYLLYKQGLSSCHNHDLYYAGGFDQENGFRNNKDLSRVSSKMKKDKFLCLLSLREMKEAIYDLAKDQNGCRILQAKFDNPTKDEIEFVFGEVIDSIADLMKDRFGNYIIQKLVSVCNDDQKTLMVYELTKPPIEIIPVCMNPYGTRTIQKLLESLRSRNQIMMVIGALCHVATRLANDPNGHHVLQYCLLYFDNDLNLQLIIDDIADNCFKVATNRYGCCVLQACVEHSRGETRNRLVSEIMANAMHIAEDPYGNYVLQHMVGLKSPELTGLLVRPLQGKFASLARNKFASNVVEKCLAEAGQDISAKIIRELVASRNSQSLLVDPYANFVIQIALKVSKGFTYECLLDLILEIAASMQTNLYGKKILERIEKRKMMQDSSTRCM
nr:pumilio homolog 12-like [Tanacetum cinerariifolium]